MKTEKKALRKIANNRLLLAFVVLVIVFMVAITVGVSSKHVFAVNSVGQNLVDWNAIPQDMRCTMIQNDSVFNPPNGYTQGPCATGGSYCNAVNEPQIGMIGLEWVFQAGNSSAQDTSANPIPVTYGSPPSSISLYDTHLSFSCHQLTKDNLVLWGSPADIPNSAQGNAPADESMAPGNNFVRTSGYIETVTTVPYGTDGGTVTGLQNTEYNIGYDGSTRYWFATPTQNFNFKPTGAWTTTNSGGSVQIPLNIVSRPVNTFNSGGKNVSVCVFNGANNSDTGLTGYLTNNAPYNTGPGGIPNAYHNGIGQLYASGPDSNTAVVQGINPVTGQIYNTNYHCPDNRGAPVNYVLDFNVSGNTSSIDGININSSGAAISGASETINPDLPGVTSPQPTSGPPDNRTTFFFDGLTSSGYQITSSPPAGYNLEKYEYCVDLASKPACDPTNPGSPGYQSGTTSQATINLGAGYVVEMRWIFKKAADCPTFPTYNNVSNTLTYNGKNNGPPSGVTTNSNATAEEDTPLGVGVTRAPAGANSVNQGSIQDISTGGSQYPPTEINESNGSASSPGGSTAASNGSINLDYTAYVNNYPYDINQPSVTYYSYWTVQNWNVTFDYNQCPDGSHVSSANTCPVQHSKTKYGNCTAHDQNGTCTACDQGTAPSCAYTYTWTTNDGSSTAYYKWQKNGGTSTGSSSSTVDGVMMPACYNRTFHLTPQVSGSSLNYTGNPDNPSGVSYTGSVYAEFGESNNTKQLRVSSQVGNIDTYIQWRVYHVDKNNNISEVRSGTQDKIGPSTYVGNTQTSTTSNNSTTATNPVNLSTGTIGTLNPGDLVCVDLFVNPDGTQMSAGNEITGSQSTNPSGQSPTNSWGNPWDYDPSSATGPADQMTGPNGQPPADAWPNSPYGTKPTGMCASQPVAHHPYFKVFQGDASAGVGSETFNALNEDQCQSNLNVNESAGIYGWNQAGLDNYAGAGAQFSALALAPINGFASAQNDPGGPTPPTSLSFANNTGSWGGDFVTPPDCVPDYYNQGVSGDGGVNMAQTGVSMSNIFSNKASGSFYLSGSQTIPAETIVPEEHLIIYVNGNVTISGNINYNFSNLVGTDPRYLPSLTIISTGEIDAAHNVSQMDGSYISESGNFNDCSDVSEGNFYTDPGDPTPNCESQLVVNGAVLSNGNVDLYRTNGSAYMSSPSETSSTSPFSAEIFNYSPLVWLTTAPQLRTLPVEAQANLPPIL